MIVTIYSRPGCHLCDDLKADLAPLVERWNVHLVERNIDDDPAAFERFRYLIPVLDIEGGPLLYPPHSRPQVEAALRAAGVTSR
jgi:thiol-disulfide isomerase/thioredoxin